MQKKYFIFVSLVIVCNMQQLFAYDALVPDVVTEYVSCTIKNYFQTLAAKVAVKTTIWVMKKGIYFCYQQGAQNFSKFMEVGTAIRKRIQ